MTYLPEALSVSLRFALWFLILPCLFMPRRLGVPDRLALGFAIMCAGAVVVPQGLSAIHLYEPISLWAATLIGAALLLPRTTLSAINQQLLDLRRPRLQFTWKGRLPNLSEVLLATLAVAVLSGTVWLRYAQSLRSPIITAADGYLHLAWLKYLEGVGGNHLFQDGIYPYGYHAIISVLHFLSFQDPFTLFRFIGPIAGVLLAVSVGYAASAAGLRPAAALLAMAVIGLGFGSPLPYSPGRQISPLPQEFAALFVLPGAIAAWRYLHRGERHAGLLALLATFLTGAIHPYSLIYLALAVILMALIGWATRAVPFKRLLRLGLTAVAFTAAAALPLGIGRLAGLPWHRSFAYVASQIGSLEPAHGLARVWTGNPALNLGLLLGLTLLVAGGILLRRGDRERSSLVLSLGVLLLVLSTQAYGATGIPVLMDPGRSGLFFSLFLALAIGITVDLLWQLKPLPTVWQTACACGLILLQVGLWRPTMAQPLGEYEYAEAANAYLAISRGFAPVAWTIVAPQEQYDEALGIGLHEQSYYFATAHTPEQMADPSFQLVDWPRPDGPAVIPTEDIFVFVEKQPLGSTLSVSPDAVAAVPGGLTPDQVHDLIYASPAERGRLEARIWGLMEAYRTTHPEQVTLYRDGAHLRVYQIHRLLAERPR